MLYIMSIDGRCPLEIVAAVVVGIRNGEQVERRKIRARSPSSYIQAIPSPESPAEQPLPTRVIPK